MCLCGHGIAEPVARAPKGKADAVKIGFAQAAAAHKQPPLVHLHAVKRSGAAVARIPKVGNVPAVLRIARQIGIGIVQHQLFNGGFAEQAAPCHADADAFCA